MVQKFSPEYVEPMKELEDNASLKVLTAFKELLYSACPPCEQCLRLSLWLNELIVKKKK